MSQRINETDLHAFLDGELDELSIRRIAISIDADPALRVRTDLYRADHEMLQRIYLPLADEPLPDRLVRSIAAFSAERERVWPRLVRRPAWQWAAGAGFAAAASLLLAVPWGADKPKDALLAEAIAVRDGAVAVEQEVAATAPAAAQNALVADSLASPVDIPDLRGEGYQLTELGVYPDPDRGRALQLDYRNGQGRRLTVYLRHPTGAVRYEILPEQHGEHVCIWETQTVSAVMVGEMSTEEMLRVAQKAYHALQL